MNKSRLVLAVMLALMGTTVYATEEKALDQTPSVKAQEMSVARTLHDEAVVRELHRTVVADKEGLALGLNDAVQRALENNLQVQQAQRDFEVAEGQVSAKSAAKNPSFTYSYSASRRGVEGMGSSNNFGHTIGVSAPIYAQALNASIDGARYNRDAAAANLTMAQQEAKFGAVKQYLQLLMGRGKAGVAQQVVDDYEGHLKNVKLQYEVGLVAKSDVLATNTRLEGARANLIQAQNGAALAEAALNHHLKLPVGDTVVTATDGLTYTPYEVTEKEALAHAVHKRPELVKSYMAVKAAEEQVKAVKGSSKPVVTAMANKSYVDDHWKGTDRSNWTVGANVSWNLWDGGQTKENAKVAATSLEKVKLVNEQAIEGILLDVKQAYLSLRSAEKVLQSTQVAVAEGEENFRIATLRYRAGVGTNLDVLDAETALATAKNNHLDALYNYNISVSSLEKAMGTPVEYAVGTGADAAKTYYANLLAQEQEENKSN